MDIDGHMLPKHAALHPPPRNAIYRLDDFQPTLARFIVRLEIEGAEEREWIIMGIINIASIMEYGRPGGVLRKVGCVGWDY